MFNSRMLLAVLLISGLFFQSCKKEEAINPDTTTEDAFFKGNMNGVSFNAVDLRAYAADFNSHINVYGILDEGFEDVIYIALPKGTTPGTYTLNEDIYAVASIKDAAYASYWGAGKGTVVVEEFDGTRFIGTFDLELENSDDPSDMVRIKDGKFNVNIRL